MGWEKVVIGIAMTVTGLKALADGLEPSSPRPIADPTDLLRLPAGSSREISVRKRRGAAGKSGSQYDVSRSDTPLMALHSINTLEDRIKYIKEMIDVGVRGKEAPHLWQIVHAELSARCGDGWCNAERDWMAEVQAIYAFVRANVRYGHDIREVDTYQSPLRTLQAHHGDCDDMSILIAALAKIAGYPVKLRVIRTTTSDDWNHIYTVIGVPPMDPKKWVPLDASVAKEAGWEAPASMIAAKKDFPV